MKQTRYWKIVLALLLAAGPLASQAQLISNGGLEGGTQGQFGSATIPGWSTFGTEGWHHSDPGGFHGGSLAVKVWNENTGLYQDFAATAGTSYDVSAFGLSASNDGLAGWDGVLKIEWFQGNTPLGSQEIDRFVGGSDPLGSWVQLAGVGTAVAGADKGRIVLGLTAVGTGNRSGSLNWDDASVTLAAIPEPSSVALMGVGLATALGAVLRRRK